MTSAMTEFRSMLAFQPSKAGDVGRRTKCRSDEMASLAMVGCVPVLGLML